MSDPRFEIVRTDADQPWHARFRGANGRIVWTTENYTRRRAAVAAVELIAGSPITASRNADHPEVSWAGNGERPTEVRDIDERRPEPAPMVAEPPFWVSAHRADFWHDGDYHWRFCYGNDECTQGTPPAGAEIAVRGGRTTLRETA